MWLRCAEVRIVGRPTRVAAGALACYVVYRVVQEAPIGAGSVRRMIRRAGLVVVQIVRHLLSVVCASVLDVRSIMVIN